MAATAVDDAWMEVCLLTISAIGAASDVEFAGLTETLDFDIGDKDIEGIPLINGGRVTKWNPQGDSTLTIEAYPLEAGTATGTAGKGFFDLMNTADAVAPIRIINSRTRLKYRILAMWTNDATATSAKSVTAANASALRIGLADGYFTSVKPSFTDGIVKFTITYKCPAFDKAGNGCVMIESCAGAASDVLPAVAAYTTANKFG